MLDKGVASSLTGLAQNLSATQSVLLVIFLFLAFQPFSIFYRLVLHRLAKFPGPKLAEASYWYEYYFDVSKKGRYIWKIRELHEQYGRLTLILSLDTVLMGQQGRSSASTRMRFTSATPNSMTRYTTARNTKRTATDGSI